MTTPESLRWNSLGSSSLLASGMIHFAIALPFLLAFFVFPRLEKNFERIPMQIVEIEKPVERLESPLVRLNETIKPRPVPKKAPQPVFGLSNNTLRDTSPTAGVEIKAGNTIAKEIDTLKSDDDNALPIPADEFLVTAMPRLLKEVRATYPEAARNARIEGPIVMDILIDAKGFVVQVQIVNGLGYGLDEAAVQAMKQFEFEPARVQEQKVAVKIRYTYRFELRS